MSPKEPTSTFSPLATLKERILSKGYMYTEIKNRQQTICIFKATTLTCSKNTTLDAIQN